MENRNNDKRLRGVIYARYSCNKQREESIEGQIRECKDFARNNNIDVINTYIDRAMSATNDNRPEFQRMISDSYLNRFDVVLIWKSDRFSRNRKQAISYREILKENKVKLLSATEPNIEGPAGILFESMNDGYNEYYVSEMKVKMKRGEKENVLEGKTNGGVAAFGYRYEKYKFYIIEDEAKIVKYMFDMYANTDLTINGLVQLLRKKGMYTRKGNPFPHGTVSHILSNRKYIGEYNWGDVKNDCVPPIIDKSLFDKVQVKLKENGRRPQKFQSTEDYILTGKIRCGRCGSLMIGESGQKDHGKKVYRYYKCTKRKHGNKCKMNSINKDVIEDYVCFKTINFLSNQINPDRLAKEIHDYQESKMPETKILEARIGEISKKMANIITAIEAGLDPMDLKSRYNDLKIQRDELEHTLDEEKCRNPVMPVEDIKFILTRCKNISLNSLEEKKMLIDLMVNTVVINDNGSIDIIYNYREREPKVPITFHSSTTPLTWSTKKGLIRILLTYLKILCS